MLQLNADAAVCTADVSSPTAYIQVSLVFPLHATSTTLVVCGSIVPIRHMPSLIHISSRP